MRAAVRIGKFNGPQTAPAAYTPIATVDLVEHMSAYAYAAIDGKSIDTENVPNLFSTYDNTNRIYLRSSVLFTNPIDWSCIPASSNANPLFDYQNGVLVTPDILIQANHAHTEGIHWFVDNSGNELTRTVVASTNPIDDVFVARLDSPLPDSISPAQILPTSAYTGDSVKIRPSALSPLVLTDDYSHLIVPCFFTRKDKQIRIGVVDNFGWGLYGDVSIRRPPTNPLKLWYSAVTGGDSASPFFLIINNRPIALSTWHTSDSIQFSSGPFITFYKDQINAAITSLGSTTSLSVVDLSGFTSYRE